MNILQHAGDAFGDSPLGPELRIAGSLSSSLWGSKWMYWFGIETPNKRMRSKKEKENKK